MASLNKLAIRGIRSFDDKQISVIEFFTPVTVIVGHNGSGKTTIIECLKYATTGDQPPNTRGGAFIHDPKMANEKEVKAQVKLRFHAANGQRMLAVRNLSVSLKKTGALQMKTLESILGIADEATEKMGKVCPSGFYPQNVAEPAYSEPSSLPNAPRWTSKYLVSWVFRRLCSRMLSFATRRTHIGRCPNLPPSRRSSMIFLRPQSTCLDFMTHTPCSYTMFQVHEGP